MTGFLVKERTGNDTEGSGRSLTRSTIMEFVLRDLRKVGNNSGLDSISTEIRKTPTEYKPEVLPF
jgi:hypothetical protein